MKSMGKRIIGLLLLSACLATSIPANALAASSPEQSVDAEEDTISPEESKEAFYEHDYLFIGDSRFVGMYNAGVKKKNITWIKQKGATYELYWLNRAQIEAMDRDTIVVYELGINDMSYEAQLATLRDLDAMGFSKVYYVGLMPVDEELLLESMETNPDVDFRSNADIKTMNKLMKKGLPEDMTYIPQFKIKVATKDGMHYTKATYKRWYRSMVTFIGEDLIREEL